MAFDRNLCGILCVYTYNRVLAFASGDGCMPSVPRQVIAVIVALTTLYAAPSVISGQELRGSLLVEVQDSSGGAVPAAHITLADENSATRLSQASDSRGEVHFPALSPSNYSLEVTAKGFAAQTQRVAISISAHPSVRFVLVPEF